MARPCGSGYLLQSAVASLRGFAKQSVLQPQDFRFYPSRKQPLGVLVFSLPRAKAWGYK